MAWSATVKSHLIAYNDDNLFRKMLYYEHHVLKQLLPGKTNHQHHLRQHRHNLCLTVKTDDRNFVIRQLFKDLYWLYVYILFLFSNRIPAVALCQRLFYIFNEMSHAQWCHFFMFKLMHFVIYRYFDSLLLYTVHLIILVAARKNIPWWKLQFLRNHLISILCSALLKNEITSQQMVTV